MKFKNPNDFKCPTDLPISGILPATERIIVIGDVHGDISQFKKTLQFAKLINDKDEWIGKNTILVQLGDLIDSCRGKECIEESDEDEGADIELLKFMISLHSKAQEHGGAVYSILGNHEIMNVQGNFSYVSPKNLDTLIDYISGQPKDMDKYELRKEAFKPGNPIASFFACSKVGILIIGSNLFVHGGIHPDFVSKYSVSQTNQIVQKWLKGLDTGLEQEQLDLLLNSKIGPFWNRTLGKLESGLGRYNQKCIDSVDPILKEYNVGQIHIGHSPQFINNLGINHTCNKKIWRHDIGMSHAFSNFDRINHNTDRSKIRNIQVLEIINDKTFNILK